MTDNQKSESGWITIPGFSRYSYHPDLRVVRRDAVTDADGRVLRKPYVMKGFATQARHMAILSGGEKRLYKGGRTRRQVDYVLVADGRINGDKGYTKHLLESRIRRLVGCPFIGGREQAPVPITDTQTGRTYPSIRQAAIAAGVAYQTVRFNKTRWLRADAQ